MGAKKLSPIFEEQTPPLPVMEPEAYRDLLEQLMMQGQGYGKTEPIAAYLFRNLRLVNSDTNQQEEVEIKPVYLVMDLTEWPNEYGRSLVIKDIWEQYASNILEEQDINVPDFQGPGMWTAKQSSFEDDYNRREEVDNWGRRLHVYDPDPTAFRVCLEVEERLTIPVPWGTYPMRKGSTLAVRSRDVEALSEALLSVRNGEASIEEALYETTKDGKTVSKFDVYGMEPEFLENNYKSVVLEDHVTTAITKISPAATTQTKPPKRKMPKQGK